MQLSANFQLSEFTNNGAIPTECIGFLQGFCSDILEPIRAKFGPLSITSGYRPPDRNSAVGGVSNSQHVYTSDHCAADFQTSTPMSQVFNWIRLQSHLPFDQVILEFNKNFPTDESKACVHVSYVGGTPRRQALVGNTHGAGVYTHAVVV